MRLPFLFVALAAMAGCKKSPAETPALPGSEMRGPGGNAPVITRPAPAEVELTVGVTSEVDAGKMVVFVTPEPCDSARAGTAKFGVTPARTDSPAFIEVFVPQGTQAYVCGAAFDSAQQLVGLGGAEGNPFSFAGLGEVTSKPKVRILALPSPRPAPAGLATH